MTPPLLAVLPFVTLLIGSEVALGQEDSPISMWEVQLAPDENSEAKFKIEGPWSIGDPVHETLTLHALIRGGILPNTASRNSLNAAQFIRGVFWNDDPCAQLLAESVSNPLSKSNGIAWYLDFSKAPGLQKTGAGFRSLECPLLGRSHFGDLQFLHSMADQDGISASTTVERILAWASVMYRIALGEIQYDAPLNSDSTASKLLSSLAEKSPKELLRAQIESETRARALGSLLHMVQDSFARGHVNRISASNGQPAGILQFLSYTNQDEKKHAHDDSWGKGTTDFERTMKIPGASEALAASTELVRRYKDHQPWSEVESYLKNSLFFIRSDAQDSGPGEYKQTSCHYPAIFC